MDKRFVIYSPQFNEDIGGSIALHRLCDLLNRNGEKAFLWPFDKPAFNIKRPVSSAYKILRYWANRGDKKYARLEKLDAPIAGYSTLHNAIIIYPEIVDHNPLFAKRIVRWFLHKPGFHTSTVNYGEGELYFYYQQAFNDERINPYKANRLHVLLVRDDIYQYKNTGSRKGSCYILRKGKGRPLQHDLKDSIPIDGLPHNEIAEIFNSVKYCISYDLYTMYSTYAAMCGCISIVIPEPGLSKEQWRPSEESRYGIAYGFDDIENAIKTQKYVLPYQKSQERKANKSVMQFIRKCDDFFYGAG